MYHKIKHFIFMVVYLLLWARFLVMLGDPAMMDPSPANMQNGLSLFTQWRPFIDGIYTASNYLVSPVYTLYNLVDRFIPDVSWFPWLASSVVKVELQKLAASPNYPPQLASMLSSPELTKTLQGYISFLTILSVLFYKLLNPLFDKLYDFFKNVIWNVLIEFSFTKKKQAIYQEALEKRAADLMKLNVEYRNLSKEAATLSAAVITDELTKVYNKRFFINKMTEAFTEAKTKQQTLSLIMMDIDHFKKLNDTYGHLMGDKVLVAVAQTAKKYTPTDCFCCRFGGEEFGVIMPGKTEDEAMRIAGDIHRMIPTLRFEEDPQLKVTSSFGLVVVDFRSPAAQNMQKFDEFIKFSDDELYKAKLNGRNRIEKHIIE